jgi:nucleotide-binding universal stress UspA family protein
VFNQILVPLDGSKMAESALPAASSLAQTFGASVTLIHVIEADAPKEIHKDRHLSEGAEAEEYLKTIADRAFPAESKVDRHVHTEEVRNVARSIVEHTRELSNDLVVMCTHGRSGVRDWFLGSIAQQVIAMGTAPVLLVPALEEGPTAFSASRLLVPLDGDPDHEQSLRAAMRLAQAYGGALYLLMVVPTYGTLRAEEAATGIMLPGAMKVMLDLAEQGGKDYLTRLLDELRAARVPARAEVARGDPVATILATIDRLQADLVVLGTHGKAGTDAFWSGSVTPKITGRANVPILLVPVHSG